jgi:hypothetical protein
MVLRPQDKRQFRRITVRTPLRCQIRGESRFRNALSENLSVNGVSFTGEDFIAPSTPVMLEINVLSKVLRPIGRITWSQPLPHSDRNRSGAQFIEFNLEEKKFLADFITMQSFSK